MFNYSVRFRLNGVTEFMDIEANTAMEALSKVLHLYPAATQLSARSETTNVTFERRAPYLRLVS